MSILPLRYPAGVTRQALKLDGSETFDITGVEAGLSPHMDLLLTITRADGASGVRPFGAALRAFSVSSDDPESRRRLAHAIGRLAVDFGRKSGWQLLSKMDMNARKHSTDIGKEIS